MGNRTSPLEGLTILVVDSDQDSLTLLNHFFAAYGIETVTASSADTALDILRRRSIDLLITEIALPIIDGYSLLHQLSANIPAIAITSYIAENSSNQAIAAGFSAFFNKPVDLAELLSAVSRLTGRVRFDAAE